MSDFNDIAKCFDSIKKDIAVDVLPGILGSLRKSIEDNCSFDIDTTSRNSDGTASVTLTANTQDEKDAQEIDRKFKELSNLTQSKIEQMIDS